MPKANVLSSILLFAVLFASCAKSESTLSGDKSAETSIVQNEQVAPKREDPGGGGGGGGRELERQSVSSDGQNTAQVQVSLETADKSQPAKSVERKIIRNADISLESEEPEVAQQKITAIANQKGGFVIQSTQRGTDVTSVKRDTVTMSIRVPSEKFTESLDEIRKTASRVVVETVNGQDVTEEFIDIEARLKAKKALEVQFLEIMKRSNSVEDALNVQREISNVRSEIEQIEGRKRFLENQSSLSTIKVSLQTPNAIAGSSKGFWYRLTDSVSSGLDVALGFILFLVSALIAILPFLLLVVLPIVLAIRYFLKRARAKKQPFPKTAESIVKEELKDE
jgi:Domain of unknown function (DUF4349)